MIKFRPLEWLLIGLLTIVAALTIAGLTKLVPVAHSVVTTTPPNMVGMSDADCPTGYNLDRQTGECLQAK